jgi:uncharacterized repeat protein (TIGR01451 family)
VKISRSRLLKLALIVLMTMSLVSPVAQSATGPFGVNLNTGYFSGSGYGGTGWAFVPFGSSPYTNVDGLGPGYDNLADFEAEYQARLFDPASAVDQGRAAAEIDIMLGKSGPSFGGSIANGITYAQANFNTWKSLMALYDSGTVPGYSIQWNVSFNLGSLSGEWVVSGAKAVNDSNWGSCGAFEGCAGDLVVQSPNPDNTIEPVVRFNVNGQLWLIPNGCACMTGTATSLSIPSPSTINLTKTASVPSIPVGNTMTYSITAKESVNIPLNNVSISDTIPGNYTPVAGSCSPAPCSISGQTVTWSYAAPGDNAVLSAIAGPGQTLSVDVKAISAGIGILNTANGTATDNVGNNVPVISGGTTTDVTAGAIKYPSVVGQGSDIHAGGGVCGTTPLAGHIDTNPNAGSYGDYVVSSPGSISNIGSNSGPADVSLRLGPNGLYSEVCRPDLYDFASKNVPSGVTPILGSDGPYDLGNDFQGSPNMTIAGTKAVSYITGDVTIHGNYTQNYPLTLVVNGNVTIDGDIGVASTGSNRYDQPAVGIIASGSISILDAAKNVHAMLFSDSTIDTCYTAPPGFPWPAGHCTSKLTVYGFLMAPSILLHRLGS